MKFSELAIYLQELEKNSSRLKLTEILSDVFKKSSKDEIDKVTYLLLGRLNPRYDELVFNVAEKMMLQVISVAYKADKNNVINKYKELGDLGDTAEQFAKKHAVKSNLTVSNVYRQLTKVAEEEGDGSVERKIKGLSELLQNLDPLSVRYVARIPVGKLRLGFSDKTVLDALSWMETGNKSRTKELEKAYFVRPDVGWLAKKVKEGGSEKAVKDVKPMVGVPILSMLGQRLKSPEEMIEKMGKVSVEPKFDGLRISIHFKKSGFSVDKKDTYKTFTRNMNETSWMFPELIDAGKYINAKEVILDSEAMGMSEDRKKLANFQTTMTRRRKHDVGGIANKVPIRFYVFDVLFKDGKSLLDLDYIERRKILKSTVKNGKLFKVVDYIVTKDPRVIQKEHEEKINAGIEGIFVKRLNSRYVPGRTGWRWVKMKESEKQTGKLSDTIECVVMGYSRGRGKRANFGVGQFLAGISNKGKIKTITKVGTGLTDDQFRELARRLKKLDVKKKPKEYEVHKDLEPDFWVEPSLVVELAADEITRSPKHTAGFALRFPRLVKFRDDKSPSQSTDLKEIKIIVNLQK